MMIWFAYQALYSGDKNPVRFSSGNINLNVVRFPYGVECKAGHPVVFYCVP